MCMILHHNTRPSLSGSPLGGNVSCGLADPHWIYLPETCQVSLPVFSICRILWQGLVCVSSPWCGEPHLHVLNLAFINFFFPTCIFLKREGMREKTSVIPVPSVVLVILQVRVILSSLSLFWGFFPRLSYSQ